MIYHMYAGLFFVNIKNGNGMARGRGSGAMDLVHCTMILWGHIDLTRITVHWIYVYSDIINNIKTFMFRCMALLL